MFEAFKTFTYALNSSDVGSLGRAGLDEAAGWVKRARSALDAYEARLLAAANRAFDGGAAGAELVRTAGGCSQREARRRARRAEALVEMPEVAGALAEGDITAEHADALVRAAEATSAEAVDADSALLAKAKSLPADLAARAAADWAHRQQSIEDREAKFCRQRELRSHRTWTDADGMFNTRGRFDPVTGAHIRSVIDDVSNRLYEADGGRDGGDRVRTWDQRNADALAAALGITPAPVRHPAPKSVSKEPGLGASAPGRGVARGSASAPLAATTAPVTGPAGRNERQQPVTGPAGRAKPPSLRNQVLVVAHTDAITGADPAARCEIPGTGPIPRSELERLACESDLFGVLFDGKGLPLWHGRKTRSVSPQQWRALVARDRGCVLCGAGPSYCHAHHIIPWTPPAEGPTDIDNLVLVCNRHHHHIHQHNLTLTRAPDGSWTASTPNRQRAARPASGPRGSPKTGAEGLSSGAQGKGGGPTEF